MRLIQNALDRARQGQAPGTPAASGGAAVGPVIGRRRAPPPPEANITYTQTLVLPVLAEHFRRHRVVAALQDNPIADAYRVLRTAVLQRMRANGWSSLAITSTVDGAGKTLTAVNLAVTLAREVNHTVLLADLDLRRPRLHRYFTDESLPGISEYLMEDVPLSDILFNPGIDRLVVLPGNKPFANSSEMLSSPRMVQLARELTERYPARIVLFDMPPLLACDDVMAFAPYVDAVLLVVEEGQTKQDDLQRAVELLEGKALIGTVLNKADTGGSAYGGYGGY